MSGEEKTDLVIGSSQARLTVKLKDGTVRSCVYPAFQALARRDFAIQQPDCVSAEVEWL